MNKLIKVLSVVLVLTGSVYLPSANAASTGKTTEMLITLAETDPVLVDRLNDIALNDPELLQQALKMAGSDPLKLERLVNLAETDPVMFWKLANIYNVQEPSSEVQSLEVPQLKEQPIEEQQMSTFGTISDGGLM